MRLSRLLEVFRCLRWLTQEGSGIFAVARKHLAYVGTHALFINIHQHRKRNVDVRMLGLSCITRWNVSTSDDISIIFCLLVVVVVVVVLSNIFAVGFVLRATSPTKPEI